MPSPCETIIFRARDANLAIRTLTYTSEDLKPHPLGVLGFKSLLVSYLKFESAVRI